MRAQTGDRRSATHWTMVPAWAVLVCALAGTGWVWHRVEHNAQGHARHEFDMRSTELQRRLATRFESYIQMLRSTVALFQASDAVTRQDWRSFIDSIQLEKAYPAVPAVAFARHVSAAELPALIAAARSSGVADFDLRPPGARPEYVLNVFTEPYSGLNIRALGYDQPLEFPAQAG